MKFIVALILAIPTFGVSLLILFIYLIYKTKDVKSNMEKAIWFLSENRSALGVRFDEISYAQAAGYASEMGAIVSQTGPFIQFFVKIGNDDYEVTLNREPNGSGAILNAKRMPSFNHFPPQVSEARRKKNREVSEAIRKLAESD